MLTIGYGVVQWVEQQLGAVYATNAVGIGWRRRGRLVAGLVFEGYNRVNIFVHIAKLRGEPMPVELIAAMFDYPFRQLKVRRISALIANGNRQSKRFAKKLGGRLEGVMEDASEDGDLCIFGLLRKDAEKWLTEPYRRRLEVFDGRSSQRNFGVDVSKREQLREAIRASSP